MHSSSHPGARAAAVDVSGIRQRIWFVLLGLLMLAASMVTAGVNAPPLQAQDAVTSVAPNQLTDDDAVDTIAAIVNPSVVTVYTYSPTFSPGATGFEPTGAGSGWTYSDHGYVITNAHVVLDVDSIKVMTFAGDLIPATVVGTDWYQDVAVLRLEPEDGQALPPAVNVGDSSQIGTGEQVIAIGTPLGQFANTVSVGTVGTAEAALNTGAGYTLGNLIQHDAALSPGSSGGPLFSMDGEVVGMNVAKLETLQSGESILDDIGFAIDGNTVVQVANEIIVNGSAIYPFLGVNSQAARNGQLVTRIEPASPAEAVGLQPGDLITAIDDRPVNVDSWFLDMLYQYDPGDTVTLTIDRNGELMVVDVVLGERPVTG